MTYREENKHPATSNQQPATSRGWLPPTATLLREGGSDASASGEDAWLDDEGVSPSR